MKNTLKILIFLVFMACSNSKSEELKENKSTNEQMAQINTIPKQDKSCIELGKYNISAEKIELKNKGLEEINCITDYRNVKVLDLRWNKIKDVKPLKNLKKLEVLKINFNQIEDIKPLLNLTNIKELWLHNNKISDIRGIGKLTKLEHLDISFNPLKNGIKEISGLKRLKRLELREVPKEIVDYVYEDYHNFMIPEKIFIEQRYPELAKKRENEIKYPNFSKFEDKINGFETVKIIRELSTKEVALNKLPKEVYKIVDEYDKNSEEADDKVEGAAFFTNNVYSIYTLTYPFAYAGQSNSETVFVKNGKVIARDTVNLDSQLESIDGNNLFLSIVAASGGTNYAITDMKSGQMWREKFRDFGLILPKRTGKIFITASKENTVNVRESNDSDSSIIYKLANNIEVEEISNEKDWKYVYFYNKDGGYYMKGYIHKSQLR
ncbi:leucine-rich repeat domain-containing protein [Leptotrichia wadei]|uniref:Leucine Rich repeat-containing domain protein n=1 Tax=Leptotrichia wadei (strain F0279) TaxID=888055 RepID=U2QAA1_LEPWF|nr:leucine-rich repeat domain-containing protein [Leptotrichia wadei]ERK53019.1 leucine Rich repeat-containing domain protein [Leptotrichia wadei F0279]